MIRVVCACGRKFKAEDQHAGKDTKCPECGADLTIGPAPVSTSTGGDADEIPAWWYPSDATARAERATAPTRSGSDPGAEAANTKVLPPGYIPKPQASSQSPPAGPRRAFKCPLRSAPAGTPHADAGASSFPGKKIWPIAGGTIALLVLAVGTDSLAPFTHS